MQLLKESSHFNMLLQKERKKKKKRKEKRKKKEEKTLGLRRQLHKDLWVYQRHGRIQGTVDLTRRNKQVINRGRAVYQPEVLSFFVSLSPSPHDRALATSVFDISLIKVAGQGVPKPGKTSPLFPDTGNWWIESRSIEESQAF